MTATLAQIWRHPIKGVGAEPLDQVTLTQGQCLPYDRHWAIAQDGARIDPNAPTWVPCMNFVRGAKAQTLMAITARMEGDAVTLNHPDLPEVTVRPDYEGGKLIDWLRPLYPENRPAPARVVAAPGRGMTDSDFPSVAILGLSSLRALSQKAGRALDPRRFRGNLWLDGTAPWEEFDLLGRTLRIGDAELVVRERITRCRATHGNPDTGRADTNVLSLLEDGWGHQDFGVYAEVVTGGIIRCGDAVT
jgi:uncharacterized protein YcbX